MNASPVEILASVFFGLAVVHTFSVKRFAHWAHMSPPGSVKENALHFLAETEVVFGLWAAALFLGIASLRGSVHDAVSYIEGLNFTEPKFVLVVMVVAATVHDWPLFCETAVCVRVSKRMMRRAPAWKI